MFDETHPVAMVVELRNVKESVERNGNETREVLKELLRRTDQQSKDILELQIKEEARVKLDEARQEFEAKIENDLKSFRVSVKVLIVVGGGLLTFVFMVYRDYAKIHNMLSAMFGKPSMEDKK